VFVGGLGLLVLVLARVWGWVRGRVRMLIRALGWEQVRAQA
jgi:hypothetical protein